MPLTLRIISYQREHLGPNAAKVFDTRGGTVGRGAGNDWVLPDPERILSGKHAAISCVGGRYYLTDTSANGVYVSGSDQPVGRDQRIELHDGERLIMGDYEIAVAVAPEPQDSLMGAVLPGNGGALPETLDPLELLRPSAPVLPLDEAEVTRERPLSGIGLAADPGAESDHVPAAEAFFRPPESAAHAIPEDWDASLAFREPPRPADTVPVPSYQPPPAAAGQRPVTPVPPPPVEPAPPGFPTPGAAPTPEQDALVAAFLRGAGLQGRAVPPERRSELLELAGEILRRAVQGLTELLMARASTKSGFRMHVTMIQPARNNPLKFPAGGVDECLDILLLRRGGGYLPAVDAFDEAFQDMRDHQVATLAGMQAAFRHLLDRLDPSVFEAAAGGAEQRWSWGGSAAKAQCWDAYVKSFQEVRRLTEEDFQRAFSDEFAKAYERQITALEAAKKGPGNP